MTALRSKLIRLAHENAELRPDLLPLLGKTAAEDEGIGDGQMDDLLGMLAEALLKQRIEDVKDVIGTLKEGGESKSTAKKMVDQAIEEAVDQVKFFAKKAYEELNREYK